MNTTYSGVYVSPLCDTDRDVYLEYLSLCKYVASLCAQGGASSGVVPERVLFAGVRRDRGFVESEPVSGGADGIFAAEIGSRNDSAECPRNVDESTCVAGGGGGANSNGGVVECDGGGVDPVVGNSEKLGASGDSDDANITAGVAESFRVGKWAASNRRKKERRRAARAAGSFRDSCPEWRRGAPKGFGAPVSTCPSYGQALSDAQREAKDSLARRRKAENEVAEKLAKMKLASLEDEKKCEEYQALKKQRLIQWRNQSLEKAQSALERVKSVDPESSMSQQEIREAMKALEDAKYRQENLENHLKLLVQSQKLSSDDAIQLLKAVSGPGTETQIAYDAMQSFYEDDDCNSYPTLSDLDDDVTKRMKEYSMLPQNSPEARAERIKRNDERRDRMAREEEAIGHRDIRTPEERAAFLASVGL